MRVRALVRLARCIQRVYEKRPAHCEQDRLSEWRRLDRRMDVARRLHESFEKAQSRGWHLAAREQQRQLVVVLQACSEAIHEMVSQWSEPSKPLPSMDDVIAELHQLHAEFDDVLIDARHKTIGIQTDSIVFEEINLGPFLVRLNWSRLAERIGSDCFDIMPLKPNPSGGDDDVSHPHVRGRKLCAGEATVPVQSALEQGRLADAFHLVRSVLETYNPDSAYASLADWGGISCWNCSCTTTEDDRYFCEGCDRDICSDCISSCKHCDRTRCSACISRCDVCNEACCRLCLTKSACSETSLCKDCLRVCEGCSAEIAPEEFDDETKRCPKCKDAANDEETPEVAEVIPSPTLKGAF